MSKLLEDIKQDINKSRNLAYCGKYSESVSAFQNIIDSLTAHIPSITDRTLITEWNLLLE